MIKIRTQDQKQVKEYISKINLPDPNSHKGQNGKILIISGSELFHASALWSAEIASYFVDMVHFASTKENNEIFQNLKEKFRNGIIVPREEIPAYVQEDDAVLVGPGMVRTQQIADTIKHKTKKLDEIVTLEDEGQLTKELTHYLIHTFPSKQFVFDAGALQMMEPEWLKHLKKPAIVTPHEKEFTALFSNEISDKSEEEIAEMVQEKAKEFSCIILLKAVQDYISDGQKIIVIEGGNAGLTKGGSGDVLAGLVTSLAATNSPFIAAKTASIILKVASDSIFETYGYWYNTDTLIQQIPQTLSEVRLT